MTFGCIRKQFSSPYSRESNCQSWIWSFEFVSWLATILLSDVLCFNTWSKCRDTFRTKANLPVVFQMHARHLQCDFIVLFFSSSKLNDSNSTVFVKLISSEDTYNMLNVWNVSICMFVLLPCKECVCLWIQNSNITSKALVGTWCSVGNGRSWVVLLVIFILFLILHHSCQRILSPQPHNIFFWFGNKVILSRWMC